MAIFTGLNFHHLGSYKYEANPSPTVPIVTAVFLFAARTTHAHVLYISFWGYDFCDLHVPLLANIAKLNPHNSTHCRLVLYQSLYMYVCPCLQAPVYSLWHKPRFSSEDLGAAHLYQDTGPGGVSQPTGHHDHPADESVCTRPLLKHARLDLQVLQEYTGTIYQELRAPGYIHVYNTMSLHMYTHIIMYMYNRRQ